MKFEHAAFNVADPAGQSAWYVAHMGMTIIRHAGGPNDIHFVGEPDGRFVFELYRDARAAVPDYGAISIWAMHIAFVSGDLEGDRDALVAAGGKAEGGTPNGSVIVLPSGDSTAFVRDPWGLTIQLIKRLKPLI